MGWGEARDGEVQRFMGRHTAFREELRFVGVHTWREQDFFFFF